MFFFKGDFQRRKSSVFYYVSFVFLLLFIKKKQKNKNVLISHKIQIKIRLDVLTENFDEYWVFYVRTLLNHLKSYLLSVRFFELESNFYEVKLKDTSLWKVQYMCYMCICYVLSLSMYVYWEGR